ncbi:MAG: Allantoinase, partial [Planctomycetota bacterium]
AGRLTPLRWIRGVDGLQWRARFQLFFCHKERPVRNMPADGGNAANSAASNSVALRSTFHSPKPLLRLRPRASFATRLLVFACVIGQAVLPLAPVSAQPPAPQPPRTRPVEGLREYNPRVFALVGGRVVAAPGKVLEKAHVVVRDGIIAAVGPDVAVPADAQVVDAAGRTIYAGFIDAYTEQSGPDETPSSAAHWSPHITPQLRMADHWKMDAAVAEKARGQGFTVQLIAPISGIFKGSSVLVATDDGERDQAVLRPVAAQHLRLTVSRGGRRSGFPNSPMGAVALARQSLLDAAWHAESWKAHQAGTLPAAPERNDALAALQTIVTQSQLVIVDASDEQFALRADRFAREFNLRIALRGSGREYRQLDAIKALERPLILSVDFPRPPHVATAESAANVAIEDLMHWDIAPENPGRLEKAGVRFALTTSGLKEPREFWPATRKAIQRGLAPDTALAALTTIPAELFGVTEHAGTIEPGKWANLAVATGDLFTDSEARIAETWVRGKRFEMKRLPVVDVAGAWKTTLSPAPPKAGDAREFTLELRRKNDELSGDIVLPAPAPAAAPAKTPAGDTAKGEKADAEARKEDVAPKKDSGDKKQPSDNDKKEAADKKPVDKKPGDKKPVDKTPGDKKPGDKKPVDKKPVDKKPGDKKPGDKKPGDKKPGDKKPVDKKPTANADGEKKPVDKKPVGNKDGVKPTGDKTASVEKPDPKKTDVKKEDSKKDEPKKDEPKKDEPKKDEPKKDEPKKDEPKKDEPKKEDASVDAKQPEPVRVSLQQLTLRDARLAALFDAGKWGFEGKAQLTAVVMRNDASAPAADGSAAPPARIAGDIVWPDGSTSRLAGTLPPSAPAAAAKTTTAADPKDGAKDGAKDSAKDTSKEPSKDAAKRDAAKASFPIVYPLGAFGREKQPEQPSVVLFKNATVWTCGPAGVLHDASVLVRDGRIEAVG